MTVGNHSTYSFDSLNEDLDYFCDDYSNLSSHWNCQLLEHAINDSYGVLTLLNTSLSQLTSAHECGDSTDHSDDHSDDHSSHDGEHIPSGQYIVLYVAFVLFLGCLFKWLQVRFKISLPYTVILLFLGMLFEVLGDKGAAANFDQLTSGLNIVRTIDPHMILNLFIPGLIFESAFNTNYHVFHKERGQAMLLAGPGVIVNFILIGGTMHYFAPMIDPDYDWPWSFCFMFGCILAATDPVAVVALLKDLGASKRLSTLIEAESLLNDGTAFVMFQIYRAYASSDAGTPFSFVIDRLITLAFLGVVFGLFFGVVTYKTLSVVLNNFQIEITFSLCMCYLAFYFAENVASASGVLTVVFMGLWVSKNRQAISPLVEETMHHFWEMVGFIANTILFFITGQVIAFKVLSLENNFLTYRDFFILIVLYVACHIIRGIAVWQLFPALEVMGYGCTWQDSVVMVYGGLRGAIGLALALIVDNTTFPTSSDINDLDKDRVLFQVCGIVFLTLIINATTVGYVVTYLGLNKPPKYTASLFKSATDYMSEHTYEKLSAMKLDKHYKGANWDTVQTLLPDWDCVYSEMFGQWEKELEELEKLQMSSLDTQRRSLLLGSTALQTRSSKNLALAATEAPQQTRNSKEGGSKLMRKLSSPLGAGKNGKNGKSPQTMALTHGALKSHDGNEVHVADQSTTNLTNVTEDQLDALGENQKALDKRVMQVMKSSYWTQYEKGLISSDAVYVLTQAADQAMDVHDLLIHEELLRKYFEIPKYIEKMHTYKGAGHNVLQYWAARLLFSNLGFAIEVAGGFLYAAKRAHHFACVLIKNEAIFNEHIRSALRQLDQVSMYIKGKLHQVEQNYPEVHQAIQTSHAAHALLHHQKHEIEKLQNHGIFDESEANKVMEYWDTASHQLFQGNLVGKNHQELRDLNILLHSVLCGELSEELQMLVESRAVASGWYQPGESILEGARRSHDGVFVITRGEVQVFQIDLDVEAKRKRTLSQHEPAVLEPGGPVCIKHSGDCFDIYPILQDRKHRHTFKASQQTRGFWLDNKLLLHLKEIDIDFWDTLWKCAALDVIRYYYSDSSLFDNFDLAHLEDLVFHSPLRYYDANNSFESQIRVSAGAFLLLLSGSLVSMDGDEVVDAPAVLTAQASLRYVAIDECVGLTLNVRKHQTGRGGLDANVKLAKIFGIGGTADGPEGPASQHQTGGRKRMSETITATGPTGTGAKSHKNKNVVMSPVLEQSHVNVHMNFDYSDSDDSSDSVSDSSDDSKDAHGHQTTQKNQKNQKNEKNGKTENYVAKVGKDATDAKETNEAELEQGQSKNEDNLEHVLEVLDDDENNIKIVASVDGTDNASKASKPSDATQEDQDATDKLTQEADRMRSNDVVMGLAEHAESGGTPEAAESNRPDEAPQGPSIEIGVMPLDTVPEVGSDTEADAENLANTVILGSPATPQEPQTPLAPSGKDVPGPGRSPRPDDSEIETDMSETEAVGGLPYNTSKSKITFKRAASSDSARLGSGSGIVGGAMLLDRLRSDPAVSGASKASGGAGVSAGGAETPSVSTGTGGGERKKRKKKKKKRNGAEVSPMASDNEDNGAGPGAAPKLSNTQSGQLLSKLKHSASVASVASGRGRSETNYTERYVSDIPRDVLHLDMSRMPCLPVAQWEEWTEHECLEVMKHIICKHNGLFEQIKDFHIQNITYQLRVKKMQRRMKQYKSHRKNAKKSKFRKQKSSTQDEQDTDAIIAHSGSMPMGGAGSSGTSPREKKKRSKKKNKAIGMHASGLAMQEMQRFVSDGVASGSRGGRYKKRRKKDGHAPMSEIVGPLPTRKDLHAARSDNVMRRGAGSNLVGAMMGAGGDEPEEFELGYIKPKTDLGPMGSNAGRARTMDALDERDEHIDRSPKSMDSDAESSESHSLSFDEKFAKFNEKHGKNKWARPSMAHIGNLDMRKQLLAKAGVPVQTSPKGTRIQPSFRTVPSVGMEAGGSILDTLTKMGRRKTSRFITSQMNNDDVFDRSALPPAIATKSKLYRQLSGHPADRLRSVVTPHGTGVISPAGRDLSKEITPAVVDAQAAIDDKKGD